MMSLNFARLFSADCSATQTLLRIISLVFGALIVSGLAVAQVPNQPQPSTPSGLKTIHFGFERKDVTRYDLKQLNTNNNTIPTSFAYGAELTGEPTRGRDYYYYEGQKIPVSYAVLWVRNDTTKTVESVDWEFTYPRFKSGKEVVNYPVSTRVKIPAGQRSSLSKKLSQDGCGLSQVHNRGTIFVSRVCGSRKQVKSTGSYPLKSEIKRVKFTDGTIWQAP